MEKNKTGQYLKYAIGEIILVVFGILIALQINNWNEKQKLDAKKQEYYVQLLDDLDSDIVSAENTIADFSEYLKAYKAYTDSYDKERLTPEEVYQQLAKFPLISKPITFNSSTMEALQNSGDIGMIRPDLRNRLIDLKRLQILTLERFEDTDDGKNDITQNISLLIGATTLPKRLANQPELKEFLAIDEHLKELILVYEGIHRWKSISQQEAIGRLEDMLYDITAIKALIKKELKK
jgi:hypothetical protein